MSRTAQELIRELAERLGELIICTATSDGTTTTIVSTDLKSYLPVDVENFHPWVYYTGKTPSANFALERRGASWMAFTSTLTLLTPLPAATLSTEQFELHARTRRSRKLEAINDAAGMLGLYWARPIVDTSITTEQNTWAYALPATLSQVSDVQIQVSTDANQATFPYRDAAPWNWTVEQARDAAGATTLTLRFGVLPPPDRTLRILGESHFADMDTDADVLALGGPWERPTLTWIMAMAKFTVLDEVTERQPAGETDRYRQRSLDALNRQKDYLLLHRQTHRPGRVNVPGMGDGAFHPRRGSDSWRYLGALRSP